MANTKDQGVRGKSLDGLRPNVNTQKQGVQAMSTTKKGKGNKGKIVKTVVENVKQLFNVFLFPNKNIGELDQVKVKFKDKHEMFSAYAETPIDLSRLDVSPLIVKLFEGLDYGKLENVKLAYKNVYGMAFGLVPKQATKAYKCVISHHLGDGTRAIVVNENSLFSFTRAREVFRENSLNLVPGKINGKWGHVFVTDESKVEPIQRAIVALLAEHKQ